LTSQIKAFNGPGNRNLAKSAASFLESVPTHDAVDRHFLPWPFFENLYIRGESDADTERPTKFAVDLAAGFSTSGR
jgi:hypothetical protein